MECGSVEWTRVEGWGGVGWVGVGWSEKRTPPWAPWCSLPPFPSIQTPQTPHPPPPPPTPHTHIHVHSLPMSNEHHLHPLCLVTADTQLFTQPHFRPVSLSNTRQMSNKARAELHETFAQRTIALFDDRDGRGGMYIWLAVLLWVGWLTERTGAWQDGKQTVFNLWTKSPANLVTHSAHILWLVSAWPQLQSDVGKKTAKVEQFPSAAVALPASRWPEKTGLSNQQRLI